MHVGVPIDVFKLATIFVFVGLAVFTIHRFQLYSKFTSLLGAPPFIDPVSQNVGKVL